jgi:chloramphenicol-sensitive protein RarD
VRRRRFSRLGAIPWISLALAFSFGIYGLIRKMAAVEALVGLTVETLILSIPAVGLLVHLDLADRGAFGTYGLATDLVLVGAARNEQLFSMPAPRWWSRS